MTDKHQCSERVYKSEGNWGHHYDCHKNATIRDTNGSWWCGTHSPEGKAARNAKWQAKYNEDNKKRQLSYAIVAAEKDVVQAARSFIRGTGAYGTGFGTLDDAVDKLEKLYASRM